MNQVSRLWWYANKIVATIGTWIEVHDKKHIILHYSKTDQLRFMTLRTWELRYRVPVYEILDILVPIMRGVVKAKRSKQSALGVSAATLTGQAAERILADNLLKRFPNAEHIAVWRSTERERQLTRERQQDTEGVAVRQPQPLTILQSKSTTAFLETYKKRVMARRVDEQSELTNKERKRKAYRWNPWR